MNVYWAPVYAFNNDPSSQIDWNMLFYNPTTLYDVLFEDKTEVDPSRSVFACPSFGNIAQKTWVFNNPLTTKVQIKDNTVYIDHDNLLVLQPSELRESNLNGMLHLNYPLSWVFFAEDSCDCKFLPPIWKSPQHTAYASLFFGEFNIGRWFRTFNMEFAVSKEDQEFLFIENDPLFCVNFSEKVTLNRFKMTEDLYYYLNACHDANKVYGKNLPIKYRYDRFIRTDMDKLIFKEIKNNLV